MIVYFPPSAPETFPTPYKLKIRKKSFFWKYFYLISRQLEGLKNTFLDILGPLEVFFVLKTAIFLIFQKM